MHFLDSNIFIYLFDNTDATKQERAGSLVRESIEKGTGTISHQVVQEVMNVMLRKLGITPRDVDSFLETTLVPLWRINPSETLYKRSLDIQLRSNYSFYDCLIIAAAAEAGCNTLYSEDLQHGHSIQRLTIKNPFALA